MYGFWGQMGTASMCVIAVRTGLSMDCDCLCSRCIWILLHPSGLALHLQVARAS